MEMANLWNLLGPVRLFISLYFINLAYKYALFRESMSESKLKLIKFLFQGVYFHRNWINLTQVIPVNKIHLVRLSCIASIYHNCELFQKIGQTQIWNGGVKNSLIMIINYP